MCLLLVHCIYVIYAYSWKCATMQCISPICILQWYWFLLLFSLLLSRFCDTFFFYFYDSRSVHQTVRAMGVCEAGDMVCMNIGVLWSNELAGPSDKSKSYLFNFIFSRSLYDSNGLTYDIFARLHVRCFIQWILTLIILIHRLLFDLNRPNKTRQEFILRKFSRGS